MRHIYTFIGSIVFCLISSASFTQIIDTNFSVSKDAYFSSNAVSSNFGSSALLYVGRFSNKAMYTNRSSIAFDISTIPANAIIVSATLKIYQNSSVGSPVTHVGRHTSTWSESGITWNNQPAYETNDLITSSSVISNWLTIDVKSHVDKMVAGVYNNNGWLLKENNESSSTVVSRTLASKEDTSSAKRPILAIKYYIPLSVSAALISHESYDGADDASVSPTLINGPGGLSYRWYNSDGNVISSNLNLSGVSYGWYGLEVSSSYTSHKFYYAFLVGLDCEEVNISFRTTPNYTSNATIRDTSNWSTDVTDVNYGGDTRFETGELAQFGSGWGRKKGLLKFNLWMDSTFIISKADLELDGITHVYTSRPNEAELLTLTEDWNEKLVTWNFQPAKSSVVMVEVDSTSSSAQNRTIDLTDFWNYWKAKNDSNFGMLFQLQLFNGVTAVQQYNSPIASDTLVRPVIEFTLDLRRSATPYDCHPVYAKVERKLSGVNHLAQLDHIYFSFDDEYDSDTLNLNYRIYKSDDRITPVISGVTSPLSVNYGRNDYKLDVSSLTSGKRYILEVENLKNEIYYIRIEKD